jgi:hypothetical protein
MSTLTSPLTDDQIEALARRRAGARLGWITHAAVFVAVNALIALSAFLHGRTPTVFGTGMVAWGFGLAMHGLWVLVLTDATPLGQRLVARERARLQAQRDPW